MPAVSDLSDRLPSRQGSRRPTAGRYFKHVSELTVLEPQPARGAALLLVHCSDFADDRPSAYTRLEQEIGLPLTRLLVGALVGPQGLRGSSSP